MMKNFNPLDSFFQGYFRAYDLFGVNRVWPDLSNPQQKDYESIRGDWVNVGNSIKKATIAFAEEHPALAK